MRQLLIPIILIALLLQSANAQCDGRFVQAPTDTFSVESNILFGGNTNSDGEYQDLRLDLYVPSGTPETERPLMIMVHGGSFIGGGKRDGEVRWFCEDLARRGIVAASIEYRVESDPLALISEEKMVKAVVRSVEDVKAGMRYFFKQIEEGNPYHIDPEAIFLGGTSAGSIASLHTIFMNNFDDLRPRYQDWFLDLSSDTIALEGSSGNPGYSGSIAGLINISGAIVELRFLNDPVDMPMLSIHNEIDLSVPYQFGFPYFLPTLPMVAGSRPIHLYRQRQGAPTKLITIQGINHVPHTAWDGSKFQPVYDRLLDEILYFIEQNSPCTDLVTGIYESLSGRLKIYPNPTSGTMYVEGWADESFTNLRLISTDGRYRVLDAGNQGSAIALPSDLQNGVYLIQATDLATGQMHAAPFMILR